MPDYSRMAHTLEAAKNTVEAEFLHSKDGQLDELLNTAINALNDATDRIEELTDAEDA